MHWLVAPQQLPPRVLTVRLVDHVEMEQQHEKPAMRRLPRFAGASTNRVAGASARRLISPYWNIWKSDTRLFSQRSDTVFPAANAASNAACLNLLFAESSSGTTQKSG